MCRGVLDCLKKAVKDAPQGIAQTPIPAIIRQYEKELKKREGRGACESGCLLGRRAEKSAQAEGRAGRVGRGPHWITLLRRVTRKLFLSAAMFQSVAQYPRERISAVAKV